MDSKVYLVITPFFPEPNSFRGPYVLDQVKAIIRNSKLKVVVLKPYSAFKKEEGDYTIDNIRVYRFKDYTLPSSLFYNKVCDWLSGLSLQRKLRTIGIDISNISYCHCHVNELGHYGIFLKKKNPNIKTMVQHHGFDVYSQTLGILGKYKWHQCLCESYGVSISNNVDLNIGVSNVTLSFLLNKKGSQPKATYVLYNGVDKSLFYPQQRNKRRIYRIGCIANFWPLKDQKTLLKAIDLIVTNGVQKIKVIFIGTGPTLDDCINYVKTKKLETYVEFRNEVKHEELPKFYNSLDLFVLPSYYEAFGCVYAEAYSCGIPFIGVYGQGISEIVDISQKERCLISKGDYKKLSELILYNMENTQTESLSIDIDIDVLISKFLNYIGVC